LTLRRQPLLAALVSDHRFEVDKPSSEVARAAVSRVSKLPTWTRDTADLCLAGSSESWWTRVSVADPPLQVEVCDLDQDLQVHVSADVVPVSEPRVYT